jgi:hypothetical protein
MLKPPAIAFLERLGFERIVWNARRHRRAERLELKNPATRDRSEDRAENGLLIQ